MTSVFDGSGPVDGKDDKQLAASKLLVSPDADTARKVPDDSWRRAYEAKLRRFWAAAHDVETTWDDPEWELFRDSMLWLGTLDALAEDDDLTLLEPIAGSIQDIILTVSNLVEGASPADVVEMIHTSLAPTIGRLEESQEGTPKRRTDIVIAALRPLRGTDGAARLAGELMRYLQSQLPGEHTADYFDTVDDVAGVLDAAGEAYRAEQVFTSHVVLRGMRELVLSGELNLPTSGSGIVSNAAYRLAVTLSRHFNERRTVPTERAVPVMGDLQLISAVTTPRLSIDQGVAARLVDELGFSVPDPVEFLTALDDMGSVGEAWQATQTGQARLVAISGTVKAVLGRPAAARLFNAGIRLYFEAEGRTDSTEAARRGQLLLNVLGLRLALPPGSDFAEAMIENGGFDCAVNLVGSCGNHARLPDAPAAVVAALEPLVRDLVDLPRIGEMFDERAALDLSRLRTGGRVLGFDRQPSRDSSAIPVHVEEAVAALRHSIGADIETEADLPLDCARLLRAYFERLLVPEEPVQLEDVITRVLRQRADCGAAFVQHYGPYVEGDESPLGRGPYVVAGLMDVMDWQGVATRLLSPRRTIAPLLAEFS